MGRADAPDARALPRAAGAIGAIVAVLAVPLVVALVVLHRDHWYPLLDMAETEIRVRDVLHHPPLIGLAGRIGPFGPDGGSHPGPISFYALWPVWALTGGSSFGLLAANVVLDIVAVTLAVWIGHRRGGLALALGIAATLATLMRAYGAFLLTLPWNPYLPVLWWFVFVLATWSLVGGDLAMLPVFVGAGTFALQTHISYLGLVVGLGALAAVDVAWVAHRRRADTGARRTLRRWTLAAAILAVAAWMPPVVDEVVHTPGNLTTIRRHFSEPPEPPIGIRRGVDVLLTQLDPVRLVTGTALRAGDGRPVARGTRLPGAVLLAAWIASAAVAWRLHLRELLALDGVLVAALALGVGSAARIFGPIFFYLFLWAWGLTALLTFAIAWTGVEVLRARGAAIITRLGVPLLAVLTASVSGLFAASAAHVELQSPRINASLDALAGPTTDALARRERAGERGPYLVSWLPDPQAIGAEGLGLLNELLRARFDARAGTVFRPAATRAHVIEPKAATSEVHLATGPDIARWRRDARFVEIAFFDPRSDSERVEFDRVRAGLIDALRRAGLAERVPQVDDNLFMLALLPRVPDDARRAISRLLDLGMPSAVFIGPAGPHA